MPRATWLELLRQCVSALPGNEERKRLVELVSLIDDPGALPPSKEYSAYSDRITSEMLKLHTELEARQLVTDTHIISQLAAVPTIVACYPPLREYARRFYKTPEILVALFNNAALVGETQGAGEWLRQAFQMDAMNEYVLWQLIVARGDPSFPRELIHDHDLFEDQLWIIGLLRERNPNDPLALAVETRLRTTRKHLFVQENLEFSNCLSGLIPDPIRNLGIQYLVEPLGKPRPSWH